MPKRHSRGWPILLPYTLVHGRDLAWPPTQRTESLTKALPETPPLAPKDQTGCGGQWFGTSEGRKATHTEIEKQRFGQQMCAAETMDLFPFYGKETEDLDQATLYKHNWQSGNARILKLSVLSDNIWWLYHSVYMDIINVARLDFPTTWK